ncbi:hypothetical protein ANN_23257 [Periplaneta americana]|uniref:Uncharacterized protein n=1 Tax=Periplaneta americana TaxID=6978 RepID=A0ABQ8SLH2_PERAM|nr:hypothetical protein ANN_23257 [Periplaneta americana]
MNPESNTESYPAFAHFGLRENSGKNLNQVTCPDRESNPGHLVSRPDALTVTPQDIAYHTPVSNIQLLRQRIQDTIASVTVECIPNLSAEQSDGITVFQISTMTSLMLHRCRTGSISLQSTEISQNLASVAQETTTCTAAMIAIEPSSSFVPISLQRDVIDVHRSDIYLFQFIGKCSFDTRPYYCSKQTFDGIGDCKMTPRIRYRLLDIRLTLDKNIEKIQLAKSNPGPSGTINQQTNANAAWTMPVV